AALLFVLVWCIASGVVGCPRGTVWREVCAAGDGPGERVAGSSTGPERRPPRLLYGASPEMVRPPSPRRYVYRYHRQEWCVPWGGIAAGTNTRTYGAAGSS